MSLSTLRQSSISRFYPVIIPVVAVAASLVAYQIIYNSSRPVAKRLKRSNARRVSRRSGRRANSGSNQNSAASSSTADPETGAIIADEHEQLGEIDIPESMHETLVEAATVAQEARGAGRGADHDSDFSYTPDQKENQNLLNLLYLIAEDQSKRDSYVHRGVTCNSCNIMPIRGIRYRCANCVDFDLCEHCEALDSHPKTHLFYKVRIPAPFLGNPRQAQTPWYPGKPGLMPQILPQNVVKIFGGETGFEPPEIEALYEQFKCLAATEYVSDPLHLHGAISRQTFDKCFVPNTHVRPPPPNLIYDRMFAFYDTDNNGLIGFEEFVRGLSALNHNKSRNPEKLKRIFKGYDLDGDGYVDRNDFLRMFRAFYALSKDLVKDMVASMEDDMLESNQAANVLVGSQPISAAFSGTIPSGIIRMGKGDEEAWEADSDADMNPVVLPSGGDRLSRSDVSHHSHAPRLPEISGTSEDDQTYADWLAASEDNNSAAAVAATMPSLDTASSESESSPVEREARRREFMDDDDDDSGVGGEEQDVGSEILYHITQRGLNELLDYLFSVKEEQAQESRKTTNPYPIETPIPHTPEEPVEGEEYKKKEPTPQEKEAAERAIFATEIRERGGPGRINLEEFEDIMRGAHASDLGFVGAWIDMASF